MTVFCKRRASEQSDPLEERMIEVLGHNLQAREAVQAIIGANLGLTMCTTAAEIILTKAPGCRTRPELVPGLSSCAARREHLKGRCVHVLIYQAEHAVCQEANIPTHEHHPRSQRDGIRLRGANQGSRQPQSRTLRNDSPMAR